MYCLIYNMAVNFTESSHRLGELKVQFYQQMLKISSTKNMSNNDILRKDLQRNSWSERDNWNFWDKMRKEDIGKLTLTVHEK